MDIEKITKEIAEKTGIAVNIVIKEASHEQTRNQVRLYLKGLETGIEQNTNFILDQMRKNQKECLDVEDIKKLGKSLHDTINTVEGKVDEIAEDLLKNKKG